MPRSLQGLCQKNARAAVPADRARDVAPVSECACRNGRIVGFLGCMLSGFVIVARRCGIAHIACRPSREHTAFTSDDDKTPTEFVFRVGRGPAKECAEFTEMRNECLEKNGC